VHLIAVVRVHVFNIGITEEYQAGFAAVRIPIGSFILSQFVEGYMPPEEL
jgi:hypothetical protein